MKQKRIRIALVALEVFVALGAIAGGIGLLVFDKSNLSFLLGITPLLPWPFE